MDINEIKKCWKEEERRISGKIEINRTVSLKKLRTSFYRIKIRRFFQIVCASIYIPLVLIFVVFPHIKNDGSFGFYLAFISFMAYILAALIFQMYSFICLMKIDMTDPILKTQKEIIRLETIEKKRTTTAYIIVPLMILCVFRTIGVSLFRQETILFIVLCVLFAIIGYIIQVKYLLPKEYYRVKSYLDEIDEADKD